MAIEADLDFATALHSLPMENGRRLRLRPLTATSNLRSGGYERGNGSRPARGFQLVVTAKFFHCETVEYCCVVDWVMATYLVLAEPPINGNTASEKWSVRTIAELPFPGVRLISAAPSDRNSLAIMVTHDRGTTRFWRLLVSGELVCFPLEFAGLCGGGVWLDNRGRRLAVNRSVEGRPSPPVMIDLYNHKVETVFSISPNTSDRVELYSPRSSLLVVSTDAGGTEWIGFAHLRTCEQLWFPEETCSSTGMRALALDFKRGAVAFT